MFFTKSFGKGGCKPTSYKFYTNNSKIENADIPNLAYIPVIQHQGVPAEIIVKIGERVEEGQLIARAKNDNSCNIHSSIPGKVVGFEEKYLFNGKKSQVIVVSLDGEFRKSGKINELIDWNYKQKEYLINTIKEYGIVELDNTVFAASIKLNNPKSKPIDTLIINGVDNESFLTGNYRLMLDKSQDILDGIKLIQEKILNVNDCYLAISSNNKDVINLFNSLIADKYKIKIVAVSNKYPQCDETLLIKSINKKVLPINKSASDLGIVVCGISTVYAIKEALINDKPLIERVVTVTGSGIANPKNLKVKFGTLLSEVIEECGGLKPNVKKIVISSSMTGYSIMNTDMPITKECQAVIVLTDEEFNEYDVNGICINCGKCIDVCGFGLMPVIINKYINFNRHQDAVKSGLNFCRECGACAYQCPARIPLVQNFRIAKNTIKEVK